MKRRVVLGILLSLVWARADQPYSPNDFFYIASSPQNKYYAVHTLRNWPTDEKSPFAGRPLLQVFRISDGEKLWETTSVCVPGNSFFLTDVPETWVAIPYWIFKSPKVGAMNVEVVTIYRKDRKLAGYTLGQLGYNEKLFEASVSHYRFAELRKSREDWVFEVAPSPLFESAWPIEANPRFRDSLMILKLNDGSVHTFDLVTGKRKKTGK